jgi:hypothetical protein
MTWPDGENLKGRLANEQEIDDMVLVRRKLPLYLGPKPEGLMPIGSESEGEILDDPDLILKPERIPSKKGFNHEIYRENGTLKTRFLSPRGGKHKRKATEEEASVFLISET